MHCRSALDRYLNRISLFSEKKSEAYYSNIIIYSSNFCNKNPPHEGFLDPLAYQNRGKRFLRTI